MSSVISRADLLRGRLVPKPSVVRPPGSVHEPEFRSLCDRCDDCIKACETNVIGRDGDGYPVLLFGHAACTFCNACAKACPTGAIDGARAREWNVLAKVKGSCLSFNAITCRACEEACEEGAIRFKLMTEGRSLPLINEDGCTGCGICAVVCPNQSIDMLAQAGEEVHA